MCVCVVCVCGVSVCLYIGSHSICGTCGSRLVLQIMQRSLHVVNHGLLRAHCLLKALILLLFPRLGPGRHKHYYYCDFFPLSTVLRHPPPNQLMFGLTVVCLCGRSLRTGGHGALGMGHGSRTCTPRKAGHFKSQLKTSAVSRFEFELGDNAPVSSGCGNACAEPGGCKHRLASSSPGGATRYLRWWRNSFPEDDSPSRKQNPGFIFNMAWNVMSPLICTLNLLTISL